MTTPGEPLGAPSAAPGPSTPAGGADPAAVGTAVARTLRVVERELRVFRRLWRGSAFSAFIQPVLYLGAMGLGLDRLVDADASRLGGLDYAGFVAPGILVATAVQSASAESLWPVMAGHKWVGFHRAVVTTPITPAELHRGLVIWTTLRVTASAVVFVAAALALGAMPPAAAAPAVVAAALAAAAFAAPLAAFAATQDNDVPFGVLMRLVILPLFLFSGTFFPVEQLPGALERAAVLSPLWHATELARGPATGSLTPADAVVHAGVLAAVASVGLAWGARTFRGRLTP